MASPTSPDYGYGVVPTGQRAPVEIINSTHHGAWVVIATALGLLLAVICLLIRIYVRVVITPPFSRDDYIHALATVQLAASSAEGLGGLTVIRFSLSYSPSLSSSRFPKASAHRLSWSTEEI